MKDRGDEMTALDVLYGKAGWKNGKYKEVTQIKSSDGIGY
jgi:hypothetical protein